MYQKYRVIWNSDLNHRLNQSNSFRTYFLDSILHPDTTFLRFVNQFGNEKNKIRYFTKHSNSFVGISYMTYKQRNRRSSPSYCYSVSAGMSGAERRRVTPKFQQESAAFIPDIHFLDRKTVGVARNMDK